MSDGCCVCDWFIGKDDKIGMVSGARGQKDDKFISYTYNREQIINVINIFAVLY